jgi:hypothetical protein
MLRQTMYFRNVWTRMAGVLTVLIGLGLRFYFFLKRRSVTKTQILYW